MPRIGWALLFAVLLGPSGAYGQLTVFVRPVPGHALVRSATFHLEVFIQNDGASPVQIRTYQVTLPCDLPDAVAGNLGAVRAQPVTACVVDGDCPSGINCDTGFNPNVCESAFVNAASDPASGSVPWLFAGVANITAANQFGCFFGSTVSPSSVSLPGGGARRYLGTIAYEASITANGTFAAAFDVGPCTGSFIIGNASSNCINTVVWSSANIPLCANVGLCSPLAILLGPHAPKKNRYISFTTNNPGVATAFRLRLNPATSWVGYATLPVNGVSRLSSTPVYTNLWPNILSVGDCEIFPVASYEIRATTNPAAFSPIPILYVGTIDLPSGNGKKWGDIAGVNNGSEWTPPNMITNVSDILAMQAYINGASIKPRFERANLQAQSSADPCLNAFVNAADVLILVKAVAGDAYPFTTNPASCPVCP